MRANDLDDYQRAAHEVCEARWSGDGLAVRVLCLAEEAGEVARCLVKMDGSHSGYRAETDWAAELRVEVGQVGFVLATIAELAGFSLAEAMDSAMAGTTAKPTFDERSAAGQ